MTVCGFARLLAAEVFALVGSRSLSLHHVLLQHLHLDALSTTSPWLESPFHVALCCIFRRFLAIVFLAGRLHCLEDLNLNLVGLVSVYSCVRPRTSAVYTAVSLV